MKYDFHFAKRQLLGVIFTKYNLVLLRPYGSLASHGGGFLLLCPYFNGIPGCKCLKHYLVFAHFPRIVAITFDVLALPGVELEPEASPSGKVQEAGLWLKSTLTSFSVL